MIWNHRIFKKQDFYTIKECFYDSKQDSIPHSYTVDDIAPGGENLKELREELIRMLKTVDKAIENENLVLTSEKIDEYNRQRKSSITRKITKTS